MEPRCKLFNTNALALAWIRATHNLMVFGVLWTHVIFGKRCLSPSIFTFKISLYALSSAEAKKLAYIYTNARLVQENVNCDVANEGINDDLLDGNFFGAFGD